MGTPTIKYAWQICQVIKSFLAREVSIAPIKLFFLLVANLIYILWELWNHPWMLDILKRLNWPLRIYSRGHSPSPPWRNYWEVWQPNSFCLFLVHKCSWWLGRYTLVCWHFKYYVHLLVGRLDFTLKFLINYYPLFGSKVWCFQCIFILYIFFLLLVPIT